MLSKTRTAASALAIATALLAHSACAADPYEAGTVLLRSEEELDFVRGAGPTAVLAEVGVPW